MNELNLLTVVTIPEACKLWGMSRTAIYNQYNVGRVRGRKMITGGGYLLLVSDLLAVYGQPENFDLWVNGGNDE